MKRCFILTVFCGGLLAVAGAAPVERTDKPEVKLYVSNTELAAADDFSIVLEIRNHGRDPIRVSNNAGFDRQVVVPPGTKMRAPLKDVTVYAHTDALRPFVRLYVPLGSPLKHIGRQGPWQEQITTIAAGEVAFIRIDVPKHSFDPGNCELETALSDGGEEVAHSQRLKVMCR